MSVRARSKRTKLTGDRIRHFREVGFLVPDYRLPPAVLDELRALYEDLLAAHPRLGSDILLGPHLETPGAQGVKGSKRWLELAARPEILDMVELLIGADIILWGTTLFGKPARQGKRTPWHQDGAYYPIRPLETLSVWIALDDAGPDNGCMQFIPGSHRAHRIVSHHWEEDDTLTIQRVCDPEHFDETTAVDLALEAGQISFHDVYMIHGSHPNGSGRRRAALVLRLMPGHCHYDHELGREMAGPHQTHDYGRRPLFLLRGRDRSGKNDFEIGH